MANIIVGDPECPFHLVCDAIFQGPTCQLLAGSLKDLARRLHVTELAFTKLDCKIKWETEHPKEMLNHVLLNWKSVQSKDATLDVLIHELEHLQLNDAVENLRITFYKGYISARERVTTGNIANQEVIRSIKKERKQRAEPRNPSSRPWDVSLEIEHPGLEREATPIPRTTSPKIPSQQRRKSSGKLKSNNSYHTNVNLCTDISCNFKVMSMCFVVVLIVIALTLGLVFGLRRRR